MLIIDPDIQKISTEWGKSGDCRHDPPRRLHSPNGATPLENGDIIVADDLRERVIVIDRVTKKIIWQYGVTDKKGYKPGYLNYPDGFDLDVFRYRTRPSHSEIAAISSGQTSCPIG